MDAIFQFDSAILLWIQTHVRAAFATPVVTFITHLGDHGLFWILLALALTAFRRTRRVGLTCVLSMLLGLIITNLAIKNLVARVRPYELIQDLELIIERQHDFSFPSGHASNAFACAWVIFRLAPKKYGVPALALAILIALSRIYVGVHYPTDILGGAAIGILCACAALWLARRLEKRFPDLARKWLD